MIIKNEYTIEVWTENNGYIPYSILRDGTYGEISKYTLKEFYEYYIKLLYENNKS